MITDKQLEEWRELCNRTIEGPWSWRKFGDGYWLYQDKGSRKVVLHGDGEPTIRNENDGSLEALTPEDDVSIFIAESRETIPLLIAEVTRLRKALEGVGECDTCRLNEDNKDGGYSPCDECNNCWKPKE